MFRNYLTLAWRHVRRSKSTAAINIFGLATGMAMTLLIGLWIADEFSFDHYSPDHARVAQAMINSPFEGQIATDDYVCMPLGQAFREQYSDLFSKVSLVCNHGNRIFAFGNTHLSAESLYAQYQLAEIFGFHILKGSINSANDPSTAFIAQSLATGLFGSADPIGQIIKVDNKIDLTVGAVYADLPGNSTFQTVKAILPWYNKANSYHNSETGWDNSNGHLYVQLASGVTAGQASRRIRDLVSSHNSGAKQETFVYPMDRVHLYGEFVDGRPSGGRIRFVELFGLIGAFVLLLACINFMNLSTARSERQAKEVGIRKTIGSLRRQIITQFLVESILISFIALAFALVFAEATLPFFNALAAKNIRLPWTNAWFAVALIGFTVFTGVLAGSYPAFYLSHFRPVQVLTRRFRAGRYPALARQALVVLQFTVSLTLIIGTIVVYRQIQFTKDRPVGYNRDGLITVDMNTPELSNNYDALSADLTNSGWVQNVAASSMDINDFDNNTVPSWRGKRSDMPAFRFHPVAVTREFGATIGWTILRGRDFSRQFGADSNAVILNEAAVALIGIKNIIGETISFNGHDFHVIGVAKDMISNSPYDRIDPTAFLGSGYHNVITLRIRPGAPVHTALASIEPIFKRHNPSSPFLYHFVDDVYSAKFEAEERVGNLATVFATLAICISCLGLFGLAAFMAEQRIKEIGVRKVLGAGVVALWALLSKDFLKLTVLSILLAVPLAWYGMNQWLRGYQYRATLSVWIFVAAGIGIIGITLLTVSYQSLRAALMNPVRSLRSE
jgi:putative ABC transport system permease protein